MGNRAIAISLGILVAASIAVAAFPGSDFGGHVEWPKDGVAQAITVFTSLLILAVFLERVLAVLVDLIMPLPTSKGSTIAARFDAQLNRVLDESEKRAQLRLVLGIVLSLMVSLAGCRTLANLAEGLPSGNQLALFNGVDVFLTAAILAGGSAGIAAIIEFWKTRALLMLKRLSI